MHGLLKVQCMIMKFKSLIKSKCLYLFKVGMVFIPTLSFKIAFLQIPFQLSHLTRIDLEVPYQDGIDEIFLDWDGDNIIYTSDFFYNSSNNELIIYHKKISDIKFKNAYTIHLKSYVNNLPSNFYIYDLAYNFRDSVIAIIANRGLIFYEINTRETSFIYSNPDLAFNEVFYHAHSNSFLLNALYFFHPNDVKNPEAIYRIAYNLESNQYQMITENIHLPELPYSMLISQFMDVDSLIVLTAIFEGSIYQLDHSLKKVASYQISSAFNPPYSVDSLFYYRKNSEHKILFQKIKIHDEKVERIEKIFTTGNYIIVLLKPQNEVGFNQRTCLIVKYENQIFRQISKFSINYSSKPFTLFNLFNFTTDDKILFRKNQIAICTINFNNDLVVSKNSNKIKIKNIRKYTDMIYDENPKLVNTYALYVSNWSITE